MSTLLREIFARLTVEADPAKLNKMTEALKTAKEEAGAAALKIAAIGAATGLAMKGLAGLAREGAEARQINAAYEELGGTLEELEGFRGVTQGLVSDTDIQKAMNLGRLFKIPAETIPDLMKIAQGSSVALGTSVSKNLDDVFTAMSRQSVMIADNLGTQMGKIEEINQEYAKQHNLNAKNLTDEQKKQAFVEAFVNKSQRQLKLAEKASANTFALLDAAIANAKGLIADIAFEAINELMLPMLKYMRQITKVFGDWWSSGGAAGRVAKVLAGALRMILLAVGALVAVQLVIFIKAAVAMFVIWTKKMWAAVAAVGAFKSLLLIIPAIIALIALMIEDVLVWAEGGDSLIGAFVDRFLESESVFGDVARWLADNKEAIIGLARAVMSALGQSWRAIKAFWPRVQAAFVAAIDAINAALLAAWRWLMGLDWDGAVEAVKSAAGAVMDALLAAWDAAKRAAAWVAEAAVWLYDAVADLAARIWSAIAESPLWASLVSLGSSVGAAFGRVGRAIMDLFGKVWTATQQIARSIWGALSALGAALWKLISAAWPVIEFSLTLVVGAVGGALYLIWEGIKLLWEGIKYFISDILPLIVNAVALVVDWASWAFGVVLKGLGLAVDGIAWVIDGLADLATWISDKIIGPLAEFLAWAVKGVGNIFKGIFGGIMEYAQPIIDMIEWAMSKVKWAAGILGIDMGPDPAAQGPMASMSAAGDIFGGLASALGGDGGAALRASATSAMGGGLAASAAPAVNATSTTTVGAVQVTVQGTTDMGPSDLARATGQGVTEGLTKAAARDLGVGGGG